MTELIRVFITEVGEGIQATGRGPNHQYLGSEFGDTEAQARKALITRVKRAGHTVSPNVETVTEKPKRPAKVGPDRFTVS
jgi:hypothetical protein